MLHHRIIYWNKQAFQDAHHSYDMQVENAELKAELKAESELSRERIETAQTKLSDLQVAVGHRQSEAADLQREVDQLKESLESSKAKHKTQAASPSPGSPLFFCCNALQVGRPIQMHPKRKVRDET